MATVSQIQSGTATIAASAYTTTATPSSYTLANSILFFTMEGGNYEADASMVRGEKTNSTTLTFVRDDAATDHDVYINWWLVEFSSGVSVQDVQFSGGESQTISAVTESQTFVVPLGGWDSTGNRNNNCSGRFEITSTTQVTCTVDAGNLASGIQVVDYTGCSVQEVVYTGGVDTTSWNLTVSSVTMGSSALFCSSEWNDNGTMGNDNCAWMWLSSSTQVDGACNGAGFTITPMFYLVSFTDNTTVERGTGSITGTGSSTTATLSSKPTDERTVTFPNASCFPYYGGGALTGDYAGDCNFKGSFTSTTQLTIERDPGGGSFQNDGDFSWEVINWYFAPTGVTHNAPLMGCNT